MGRDVVFRDCDFSGAVLDRAALTRAQFIDCRLTSAIFSSTKLNDVIIEGRVANLANFRMSKSTLLWIQDTSLTEADHYAAQLRRGALLDCNLSPADFSAVQISGLSLYGSILEWIRGAAALADTGVSIGADQIVPLGVALLGSMGVQVVDRPIRP